MKSFQADNYNPSAYNLTLSVLFKHHPCSLKKLLEIQARLTSGLACSSSPNNYTLYSYRKGSLHFSIINFATATVSAEHSRQEFEKKYKELKEKLDGLIRKPELLEEFRSWKLSATKLRIDSTTISVNIVLNNKFESELKEALSKLLDISQISDDKASKGLKFYASGNNFAVNLIRTFRALSDKGEATLHERVNLINKELGKNNIDIEISKLSLVVSDNYLSNEKPEVLSFDL